MKEIQKVHKEGNGNPLLPGKSHGQRSLVDCSSWSREESDMTERLHFHFSLSCIGEENGNPLQCSCLENPRDGGAWWAAAYGVTQSQTRLKRLSSSSRSHPTLPQSNLIQRRSFRKSGCGQGGCCLTECTEINLIHSSRSDKRSSIETKWWWCGDLVAKLCQTLVIARTVAHQAPLSMGFPRQEQ